MDTSGPRTDDVLARGETVVSLSRRGVVRVALGATLTTGLALAGGLRTVPTFAETSAGRPAIRVGAKDFTEDQLVAHMYTLVLQQAGFSVSEHFDLPTAIAHNSLIRGDIDLYPEYTGTGLEVILKETAAPTPDAYYRAVAGAYEQRFHLTWLLPSPMNDTQGLATTGAVAKRYQLRTISDMVKHASRLRFITPGEYLSRPDGLPALKRVYGNFAFKSMEVLGSVGSLRYAALLAGQGDIVVAFTTDGEIVGDHLTLLVDDRHFAPPDQVAPVVRDDVLHRYPQIRTVLNRLAPMLTSAAMQELNYAVDSRHQDLPETARIFLQHKGLLQS